MKTAFRKLESSKPPLRKGGGESQRARSALAIALIHRGVGLYIAEL